MRAAGDARRALQTVAAERRLHPGPLRRAAQGRAARERLESLAVPLRAPVRARHGRDAACVPRQEARRRRAPAARVRRRSRRGRRAQRLRLAIDALSPSSPSGCAALTAMLPLVLVIASDRDLCEPFRHELSGAGFKAYYVESLPSALAVLAQWRFDAALLLGRGFDASLLRLLQSLRDAADVPTLAVLDAASEERQLQVLDAGAAQVLVEPTSLRIVAAQLRCLVGIAQQRPR